MNNEAIRQMLAEFDDFLNTPPQYEELRMVRDYRHEAYAKWDKLSRVILSALSAAQEEPQPQSEDARDAARSGE